MPGTRLTRSERDEIAAGLRTGLDYAEIGRRIGRPTSTVTREVGRNGGPAGYEPQRADARARERGRRSSPSFRRPRGNAERGSDDAVGNDLEPLITEFVELLVTSGLQRMGSRVFVQLYLTERTGLTAAELVSRLGVSPAAVSKAVGYLEGLGLIERTADPIADARSRRERYLVGDDIWARSWAASMETNRRWADLTRRGADLLSHSDPVRAHLREAHRFFAALTTHMATAPLQTGGVTDVVHTLQVAGLPITVDQLHAVLNPAQIAALKAADPV